MPLLIANSGQTIKSEVTKKIEDAYKKASTIVSSKLDLDIDSCDIVVVPDKYMAIPEIGIGGYSPTRHLMYLYIDPDFQAINELELLNTLCHELHHIKRYESVGYGETLLESMIFEGLAVAFEEEVSGSQSFLPNLLSKTENIDELVKKSQPSFDKTDFNHHVWFIYDKDGDLGRWAGYRVGYSLIKQYIEKTGEPASSLVLADLVKSLKSDK